MGLFLGQGDHRVPRLACQRLVARDPQLEQTAGVGVRLPRHAAHRQLRRRRRGVVQEVGRVLVVKEVVGVLRVGVPPEERPVVSMVGTVKVPERPW